MNKYVLDSSALLALLNSEPGGEKVAPILGRSLMSTVNTAEVLAKLAETGVPVKDGVEDLEMLGIEIIDFDLPQAVMVADLRNKTKKLGLSLGDRSCLALAIREKAIALTADRTWKGLKVCHIELIR